MFKCNLIQTSREYMSIPMCTIFANLWVLSGCYSSLPSCTLVSRNCLSG